jgi:hypothetical protein
MVSTLDEALRALNNAAYAAAKAARKESDPRAAELKALALRTDDLVEGRASPAPAAFASSA